MRKREVNKAISEYYSKKLMFQFRKGKWPKEIEKNIDSILLKEIEEINSKHDKRMQLKREIIQSLTFDIEVYKKRLNASWWDRFASLFGGKL